MSVRHLEHLFEPKSIAVIGASNRPGSVGAVLMRNLLRGEFSGPTLPVHPKEQAVAGVLAYRDVESLPLAPDLAVICTPPRVVPDLIDQLGRRGTRAAIVITAGLSHEKDDSGTPLQHVLLDRARPYLMRILGPNCVGAIIPHWGVNATFMHVDALPGKIAMVSQSGALCASILDWARSNDIGFSHFISLGDSADVDFGDTLDYLAGDPHTDSILLYIEAIGLDEARKFMSAARAAARNKPVIVVKSGRFEEGARAAASHTGALAGADIVYDAAIRRAGLLRVFDIADLFNAVETLARAKPFKGDRLAIVTNGGGPGVLATDALIQRGGRLAPLSPATVQKLGRVLPPTWSRGNPVDIIGDAPGQRYADALKIVLEDPHVDAVLVMNVPTAIASSQEAARHVIEVARNTPRCVLTSWLGKDAAEPARALLREAGLPTYETPTDAINAFMHTVDYRRNQDMLMQVPPAAPVEFTPDVTRVRGLIAKAVKDHVDVLSEVDAKAVLEAYGVPVIPTRVASDVDEALALAREMEYPVALKILSPHITHKSDVGGVALDLETPEQLRHAAQAMLRRVGSLFPDADVKGFTVQRMARRPRAQELIIGVTTDRVFGPVILFGQGGTAVEVVADRAVALPPLNMALAKELISRTRVYKLLQGFRDRPAADLDAICVTLMQVAQLIVDVPEIVELDVNPLFADESGVLALDARVKVHPAEASDHPRLAIRPYPGHLEETLILKDGRSVLARPIRPEDYPAHERFVARLAVDDLRRRFLGVIRDLPPSQMARLTQIDYEREMAFIAVSKEDPPETLGVVRVYTDPDHARANFAIIVRSDLQGAGLGEALMRKIIRYCRSRGVKEMLGNVLRENTAMLNLARKLGFEIQDADRDHLASLTLRLSAQA